MMVIDIRKLNAQKKYSGSMEFTYEAPAALIEIPFTSFAAPVIVRFDYELYEDDSLEIKGTVAYRLEGKCSRCLKNAAVEIEGELDAYFQNTKEPEDYGYTGYSVDLTKAVEDAIMLSMPYLLLCDEACAGLEYSDDGNSTEKK